jgi:hypothetical protein
MRKTLTILLPILTACGGGGDDSPTGPGPGPSATVGTFTATLDGTAWVSTTNQVAGTSGGQNQVPGVITMIGTQVASATNYTTITVTLGYIAGTGTYPLGVNHGTTAGGIGTVFAPQGGAFGTWSTNLTGSGGSVNVTSLTGARIAGTFQFTAPPQTFTSTTGTKVVTNGAFDMPLPAGFVPATASNPGSRMSASINGTTWNGATVLSVGNGGVFVLGGTTDTLSVSIATGTVVSAGNSYPVGGSNGATMTVIRSGTSRSWASGNQSTGTLTITSLTPTRVTGTFTATLSPLAGTTGTLAFTNGAFSIQINSP